jgi:pyruvate dehydrogenase (quinone)
LEAQMSHTVADVLIGGLEQIGVKHIFGLIGDSLNPLADAIRRSRIEWIGGIGIIGTKAVYNAVMHCDSLLMLGTDYPYSEFLPRKGSVIQIDDRARVLGRRAPTALGVVGSVRPTLKLLLSKIATKSDTKFWDQVTKERQKWDEMLDKHANRARSRHRIHPQAVARAVSDLAKPDAVFTLDSPLLVGSTRE